MTGQPFERIALPTYDGGAKVLAKYKVEARGIGLVVLRCPAVLAAAVRFDAATADAFPLTEGDVFRFTEPFTTLFFDSLGSADSQLDLLEVAVLHEGFSFTPGALKARDISSGLEGVLVRASSSTAVLARIGWQNAQLAPAALAVTAGVAYVAGECVGGLLQLANVPRSDGGYVELVNVCLTDAALQNAALDLVFFNANPVASTFTDKVAAAIAAADVDKVIGRVRIAATDYATVGGVAVAAPEFQAVLDLAAGTTLYAALVAVGAPTYPAATDLRLKLGVRQP